MDKESVQNLKLIYQLSSESDISLKNQIFDVINASYFSNNPNLKYFDEVFDDFINVLNGANDYIRGDLEYSLAEIKNKFRDKLDVHLSAKVNYTNLDEVNSYLRRKF